MVLLRQPPRGPGAGPGATALVGAAGFLTAVVGQDTAYTWLLNVSALCGFIVWLGIAVCHFRFRRAYVLPGP